MANRSRSNRSSGVVKEPGEKTTKAPGAPVVRVEPTASETSSETRSSASAESRSISLSHEDFDNNPAVVNMADVPGVENADAAAVALAQSNEQNEANARRIIEQDRSKPAGSPFSNADVRDADADADELDDDDPLAGAPLNQPGPAVEAAPAGEADEPKKGAKKTGSVLVTLGDRTKNGGRAPFSVSVIVPPAGQDTDDAHDGLITAGSTIQLARGRATRVSARAAEWLEGHRLYDIREATVNR